MTRTTAVTLGAVALAALGYGAARLVLPRLDDQFRVPYGAGSLDEARRLGTLIGTYRPAEGSCAALSGEAFAEQHFTFSLGPLLNRRVHPADTFGVIVPAMDPDGYSLEGDDGSREPCCTILGPTVPERVWLVRDEQRVCELRLKREPVSAAR